MPDIDCITLEGEIRRVPAAELTLRPAAYALILADGQVALLKMKRTGRYHLPGGGIEVGEKIAETLVRETREETGLEIAVGKLVHFDELFFYYDPSGRAYHGLHFYYLCRPLTRELLPDNRVQDGSAGQPRWVAVDSLRSEDFQSQGEAIMRLCREYPPSN
jgi:8-oxo-dGTP diphosphatase